MYGIGPAGRPTILRNVESSPGVTKAPRREGERRVPPICRDGHLVAASVANSYKFAYRGECFVRPIWSIWDGGAAKKISISRNVESSAGVTEAPRREKGKRVEALQCRRLQDLR